jgi:hypothetical protein
MLTLKRLGAKSAGLASRLFRCMDHLVLRHPLYRPGFTYTPFVSVWVHGGSPCGHGGSPSTRGGLSWSLGASHWSLGGSPWGLGGSPWGLGGSSWSIEAHPGAMEAHPGAVKTHPGAFHAYLDPWRLTLDPCMLTLEPSCSTWVREGSPRGEIPKVTFVNTLTYTGTCVAGNRGAWTSGEKTGVQEHVSGNRVQPRV